MLERSGAGSIPWCLRILQTVDAPTVWPRPFSSPAIRRYPQVGFWVAISTMSRRISTPVVGLPGVWTGWVQCLAMRRRCHRSRVSGVTSHPWRRDRGSAWAMAPSSDRSLSVSVGRLCGRRSTASWWRRTMISMSLERPDRTARRANDVRKRCKMRCTPLRIGRCSPWSTLTSELIRPPQVVEQHPRMSSSRLPK